LCNVDIPAETLRADHTASSVTLDPVLHFIVYVPENHSRPMRIRTATGECRLLTLCFWWNIDQIPWSGLFSDSNAFITPQHGGVVIYNPSLASDLSQSFNLVSHQLSILLGVPSLPSSLDSSSPTGQLTNWQITAVMLRTLGDVTTESVDTLNAIIKLTEDTSNMRVGKDVLSDVIKSLAELDLVRLPFHCGLPEPRLIELESRPNYRYHPPSLPHSPMSLHP
jgi:phosphatidylinositol glycan class S